MLDRLPFRSHPRAWTYSRLKVPMPRLLFYVIVVGQAFFIAKAITTEGNVTTEGNITTASGNDSFVISNTTNDTRKGNSSAMRRNSVPGAGTGTSPVCYSPTTHCSVPEFNEERWLAGMDEYDACNVEHLPAEFFLPSTCTVPAAPRSIQIRVQSYGVDTTTIFWTILWPIRGPCAPKAYFLQIYDWFDEKFFLDMCQVINATAAGASARSATYDNERAFAYPRDARLTMRKRKIKAKATALPLHAGQANIVEEIFELPSCFDLSCYPSPCNKEACFQKSAIVENLSASANASSVAATLSWTVKQSGPARSIELNRLWLAVYPENSYAKAKFFQLPKTATSHTLHGLPPHTVLSIKVYGIGKTGSGKEVWGKYTQMKLSVQPPVDCVWTNWTYEPCQCQPGEGFQQEVRMRLAVAAKHGGRDCVGNNQETVHCHCASVWSDWSVTGDCEQPCGPRQALRRVCYRGNGSAPCTGSFEVRCLPSCVTRAPTDSSDLLLVAIVPPVLGIVVILCVALFYKHLTARKRKINLHRASEIARAREVRFDVNGVEMARHDGNACAYLTENESINHPFVSNLNDALTDSELISELSNQVTNSVRQEVYIAYAKPDETTDESFRHDVAVTEFHKVLEQKFAEHFPNDNVPTIESYYYFFNDVQHEELTYSWLEQKCERVTCFIVVHSDELLYQWKHGIDASTTTKGRLGQAEAHFIPETAEKNGKRIVHVQLSDYDVRRSWTSFSFISEKPVYRLFKGAEDAKMFLRVLFEL